MPKIDTDEWHFKIDGRWVCKIEPTRKECGNCSGRGKVGGGFKDPDEARTCHACYGSGIKTVYPEVSDKPEIPVKLIQHMRNAYEEYLKKDVDVCNKHQIDSVCSQPK